MTSRRQDAWNGQRSTYEDDYYRLVNQSRKDLNSDSLYHKYLDMEASNERLMRLKQKFGDNEASQFHLKSIYESQYFKSWKPTKEQDPNFNIVKNVDDINEGPNVYHHAHHA